MSNIKITGGQVLDNGLPVGLGGTRYVYVRGNGTTSANATELQAAYNKAKTMYPSSGNTVTVVVAPGQYKFGETAFTVDTPYINIVSLTGNDDVLLDGINVTANNVYLKGLNCGTKSFTIAGNLDGLVCENCTGGGNSFGGGGTASGIFTNCTGGDYSFGGTASGTFNYCTGGVSSFGGSGGTASGNFTNCTGGDYSFGSGGNASGTFIDCVGGDSSFGGGGGGGTASGTFTDCTGSTASFGGGGGTASGTFNNCTGGNISFGGAGGDTTSGFFNYCTGGDFSFGAGGTASGTFNYCTGGVSSFGGGGGGTVHGTFNSCTGGNYSFGGSGGTIDSTARLYYCRLTTGTFETPEAGGKIIACVDGNDDFIMIS